MGGNNTSAVRIISDQDFAAHVDAGLSYDPVPDTLPRHPGPAAEAAEGQGFADAPEPFTPFLSADRLISRAIRDPRCGIRAQCASGLSGALRDFRAGTSQRRGRPEVEAAYIRPVAAEGPDTVRNGLAPSETLHWMFDRSLIGIDDDHSILIARGSIADEIAGRLIHPGGKLLLPPRAADRPHASSLDWHRKYCFKG